VYNDNSLQTILQRLIYGARAGMVEGSMIQTAKQHWHAANGALQNPHPEPQRRDMTPVQTLSDNQPMIGVGNILCYRYHRIATDIINCILSEISPGCTLL
jgi:hypothetical protein